MNLGQLYQEGLIFANFNQDATCLSVGTSDGFKVCNTQPNFSEVYSQEMAGVGICEMLFASSFVAIVGSGDDPSLSPRKLQILNTKTQTSICELNFITPILAVKMNRKRLIVVLETKIHIYDISTMKILHTIDTVPNPKGICALAVSEENCYLAYPNSIEKGSIVIFDALTLQMFNVINAHKTPVSRLTINEAGTLMATCSAKGTVIRVYSLPDASRCYQFRRGSYFANLYCLAFSFDSSLLCVSSDTGTVHIFKIDQSSSVSTTAQRSSMSSYISDMWEGIPARSFALLKLPNPIENVCAINKTNTMVMIGES
eukprot:TRINITY_DN3137_c0_g1_i3.p1 TRINITY_DN3137_c0_g1~~TRINITY_DN3137_c0_g1_i3.p1  ORF type:complete len:314 (-),score=42.49 TRINITY_DN3137_c0_g1_i3:192-1133(-)